MKIELTLAQLHKLSRLAPGPWRALLAFVQQGGSGDFSPDLQPLRDVALIQKVGPLAYVKFPIDGSLPQRLPQAARRSKTNDMAAFLSIWRKNFVGFLTGADMAALKRFTHGYSLEEFQDLIKAYKGTYSVDKTVKNMWAQRNRLAERGGRESIYEEEE